MKIKKSLKMSIYMCLVAIAFLFLVFLINNKCLSACHVNYCSSEHYFGMVLSIFIMELLRVLFAMLFWFISPIGILFLLGIKLFFSKRASVIRRNFALLLQFLSFLSWFSLMLILIVVYIDSISYKVLNLGGDMLNLAIKSGFGFMLFMIILAIVEKKIIFKHKHGLEDENDDNKRNRNENNNSNLKKKEKEKDNNKSEKISRDKTSAIKSNIKRKIKEEIKEIIDDKIDRL